VLTYHANKNGKQPVLALVGALTIYTVAEARREIPTRLAKRKTQALDLSGIEELDTSGVQLLLWLKCDAAIHGAELALLHHSPAVVAVLDLLRLTATFGDTILELPPTSSRSHHGS